MINISEKEIMQSWDWGKGILVSIDCSTFNHENFISQALDSFLMQKTTFPFEIIVHDDASTDKTPEIIKEYEKKFPNLFVCIYQKENQFSKKGINIWADITFPKARGKYIALCEGDDYWTDPYKLQKQVDFLEANPEYVLSAHRYKIFDEEKNYYSDDYGAKLFKDNTIGFDITIDNLFDPWLTKTLTVVFRRDELDLSIVKHYNYFRDTHLIFHLIMKGKGYVHNFFGGVYRLHENGIHGKVDNFKKIKTYYLIYKELYLRNKDKKALKAEYLKSIENYTITLVNQQNGALYSDIFVCIKNYLFTSKSLIDTLYLILRTIYHKLK